MKLFNLRSLVGGAALGVALIAGASDVSAQGWGQNNQSIKRQQKIAKERMKLERQRLRLERQRMQTVQAQNRYRVYRNGGWYSQALVFSQRR